MNTVNPNHKLHWIAILAAGTLLAGLAGCGDSGDSPAEDAEKARALSADQLNPLPVRIETLHSGEHALVRRILLPTPASVGQAFYLNNPIFPQTNPAEEQVNQLSVITLDGLIWPEVLVNGTCTDSAAGTPLTEENLTNGLPWQPLRDFVTNKDEDLDSPLSDLSAAIASQRWGGPLPEVQKPRQLFIRNPEDPALMEFWLEIEFAPWAPVATEITDSDGNGAPEVYAQIQPELIDPDLAETIISEFMGQIWGPDEVDEYLEWFLGEVYNQTYAMNRSGQFSEQFPTDEVEDYVKEELGDLQVETPDIVIRAGSDQMPKIYNVFTIDYDSATPDTPETGQERIPDAVRAPEESAQKSAAAQPAPAPTSAPAPDGPVTTELPEPVDEPLGAEAFRERTQQVLDTMPEGQNVLIGYQDWLFLPESLQLFLDSGEDAADLEAIKFLSNLGQQLKQRGVRFVYVSVPAKSTVYPQLAVGAALSGEDSPSALTSATLQALRDEGVEVLDLTEALRTGEPGETFLKTDTHWNPTGISQAAQAMAELAREHAAAVIEDFQAAPEERSFRGDLMRNLPADLQQKYSAETVEVQVVRNVAGEPVGSENPGSPVLILGDSYTVIFESGLHGSNAGLASQLAQETGMPVNQIALQGGGPEVARDLARKLAQAARDGEDYLAGTGIVFMVMTERRLIDPNLDWQTFDLPAAPAADEGDPAMETETQDTP